MTDAPLQIAIVGDVLLDRTLVRCALAEGMAQAFVCHEGANGADALALCCKLPSTATPPIDILLLDMQLPDIDSGEVLEQLKGNQAILPLPVIMLTDAPQPAKRQAALAAGAQDFIPKDQITPENLTRAVLNAIERFRLVQTLQVSEERYRRLVETQSDLICRFQTDFRLTFVNQAYSALLNKRPEEMLGQAIFDFIPAEYHTPVKNLLTTLTPTQPSSSYENPTLLADGSWRWYQWTDRLITDEAGQPIEYQAVGRDVTERRRAEQAEREQRQLAEALRDGLATLTSSLGVEQVMQQILTAAATVVPSEGGSIILFEGEQSRVAYLRGFPRGAEAFFNTHRFPIVHLAHGDIRVEKKPYFITDTHASADWQPLPFSEWIRSSMGMPIELHGEVIGQLVVDSATPNHFCAADVDKLSAFAHYAGLALDRAEYVSKLEARVVERTAELQTAKEHVEAILNHSPDSILLIQPDLSIQQTNAAFETLFGDKSYTCCGQSLHVLLHPDDLPRVQALIQAVGQREVGQPIEVRAQRRNNGTVFDAELSIGSLPDGKLVCTIRDITERKRAQKALAEERNLLRTLIDAIPDLIYVKNLQHRFVLCNTFADGVLRKLGARESIGITDTDVLPPALAARVQAIEKEIIHTGQPSLNQEEELTMPDGRHLWISTTKVPLRNLSGELIGLAGVSRNVTQQKENERRLRYYASLQETVSDAVIATDLELRIQSWNRAAERIYGWRADEVMGQIVSDVLRTAYISPEGAADARQALLQRDAWEGEITQHRKDGMKVYILASFAQLKDEQGKPFGLVGVNHDITPYKLAQEAIRASEERYRLLADNITDLVARGDADNRYVYVSPSCRALTGYEPAELIGQARFNFIHPDDIPLLIQLGEQAREQQRNYLTTTSRFRHKQGHYIWLETNIRLIYAEGTQQVVEIITSARDITERKRAEETLRLSEEKFRLLVAAAPIAIIITDQNGQITLVNHQASVIFDYQSTELLGQSIELLAPAAAKANHIQRRLAYQRAPQVGRMGSGRELFAQRKDGSAFPVEIELSYVETAAGLNVICFILDITERKRAQEALREQRDFLQLLVDLLPHPIAIKDSAGRFQLANQSAAQLYNIQPAEMVGKLDSELNTNPAQVAFFRQKDLEALQNEQPIFIPEQPILDRYYQTNKIPLKNRAGQVDRLLIVSTDITTRKQTEAALQQALKREKELGELKSRFVSMASHEFRTPLAAIRAIAETLYTYRHKLPDDQIGKRLGKIQEQVDYLKGIIEDVMQLTRLQARRVELAPTPLNLDALCHEVLDELQNQFHHAASIHYTGDITLNAVHLDKKLSRQIINNLVSNALKYSPEDKPVRVNLSTHSDMIHFTVCDQGIGIPEADLAHLFEPFHRAANVGNISGTGLGLTITKESVEMLGGTLTLESRLGIGTTVKVALPRVTNGAEPSNAEKKENLNGGE
ncbi:MAG: PAS domain S-box protein [Caldilineaceae bacterium]